ncbi:MAG: shikimate dehydrogenase [Candidatus Gracilibacteria bacterium]
MPQLFGIIAHPVAHSLSPAMHNAAFKALKMEARFDAFDVLPEDLGEFMKEHRELKGMAVSIPHKETVGHYLDEIDPIAREIGAVNTVYWKGEKRCGTNTDAPGFLSAVKEAMPELEGKRAVVLGAGGAARAVVWALNKEGMGVTILNRTVGKAKALAEAFHVNVAKNWDEIGGKIDLIVNTTSVGLEGHEEPELVPARYFHSNQVVFDLVYRKKGTTRLLATAQSVGAKIIDGKAMLLYQGVLQFEWWTGEKAPEEVMRESLG